MDYARLILHCTMSGALTKGQDLSIRLILNCTKNGALLKGQELSMGGSY